MSQHEPTHRPPYSFGRDRHRDSGFPQDQVRHAGDAPGPMVGSGEIPPPPAGHRGMVVVIGLYVAAGFMVLWTGASVAVTLEAVGDQDGTQVMVGMFMAAASLAITVGLAAWLIRTHRRRAGYRRILDEHYAQRFGHHPDGQ